MDFILSAVSFIFLGLIVVAAFTIGFSLLLWFTALGVIISLVIIGRQYLRRWRFLRNHQESTKIIEGTYKEITDHKP